MGRLRRLIISAVLVVLGTGLALAGVAAIYPPAALILAGAGLACTGLVAIDVKKTP